MKRFFPVTMALAGFLVSGLMEWNVGDEELLDLLYVMVGVAFAASLWKKAPELLLVERMPDQPFGARAMKRRSQETTPPSPPR